MREKRVLRTTATGTANSKRRKTSEGTATDGDDELNKITSAQECFELVAQLLINGASAPAGQFTEATRTRNVNLLERYFKGFDGTRIQRTAIDWLLDVDAVKTFLEHEKPATVVLAWALWNKLCDVVEMRSLRSDVGGLLARMRTCMKTIGRNARKAGERGRSGKRQAVLEGHKEKGIEGYSAVAQAIRTSGLRLRFNQIVCLAEAFQTGDACAVEEDMAKEALKMSGKNIDKTRTASVAGRFLKLKAFPKQLYTEALGILLQFVSTTGTLPREECILNLTNAQVEELLEWQCAILPVSKKSCGFDSTFYIADSPTVEMLGWYAKVLRPLAVNKMRASSKACLKRYPKVAGCVFCFPLFSSL